MLIEKNKLDAVKTEALYTFDESFNAFKANQQNIKNFLEGYKSINVGEESEQSFKLFQEIYDSNERIIKAVEENQKRLSAIKSLANGEISDLVEKEKLIKEVFFTPLTVENTQPLTIDITPPNDSYYSTTGKSTLVNKMAELRSESYLNQATTNTLKI